MISLKWGFKFTDEINEKDKQRIQVFVLFNNDFRFNT